jgi:hypothetical protein
MQIDCFYPMGKVDSVGIVASYITDSMGEWGAGALGRWGVDKLTEDIHRQSKEYGQIDRLKLSGIARVSFCHGCPYSHKG